MATPSRTQLVRLYNGVNLDGWENPLPNGSEWKVTTGVLEGTGGGLGNPAVLVTQRQDFVNYRLIERRFDIRQTGSAGSNTDVVGANEGTNGYVVATGIWPNREGIAAGSVGKANGYHYGTGFGFEKKSEAIALPANTWYIIEFTVVRNRITTRVNGQTLTDYTDGADDPYKSGSISLVCNGKSSVQFESIMIEELPE